jgi:hypothetical protein
MNKYGWIVYGQCLMPCPGLLRNLHQGDGVPVLTKELVKQRTRISWWCMSNHAAQRANCPGVKTTTSPMFPQVGWWRSSVPGATLNPTWICLLPCWPIWILWTLNSMHKGPLIWHQTVLLCSNMRSVISWAAPTPYNSTL